MAKVSAIPAFIDHDNNVMVLNKDNGKIEEYKPAKHKAFVQYYGVNFKAGTYLYKHKSNILICDVSGKADDRYTVLNQTETGIIVVDNYGVSYHIPFELVQDYLNNRKITGIELINGCIATNTKNKGNTSTFKLDVPNWLKIYCDDSWNILTETVDDAAESGKNTSHITVGANISNFWANREVRDDSPEIEGNQDKNIEPAINDIDKPIETVADNREVCDDASDNVDEALETFEDVEKKLLEFANELSQEKQKELDKEINDTLIEEEKPDFSKNIPGFDISYIDFYNKMLELTMIGDIVSIPVEVWDKLSTEILDIFDSNKSGTISKRIIKVKTSDKIYGKLIGVLDYVEGMGYYRFQIMNKPNNPDSVPLLDIRDKYFIWKNTTRIV